MDIFPFFTKYLTEINFVNNLIQMQHFATLGGCEEQFQIFFHTWKKKYYIEFRETFQNNFCKTLIKFHENLLLFWKNLLFM